MGRMWLDLCLAWKIFFFFSWAGLYMDGMIPFEFTSVEFTSVLFVF